MFTIKRTTDAAVQVNLVSRVFVPLDQRSENKSSWSNHFRRAQ